MQPTNGVRPILVDLLEQLPFRQGVGREYRKDQVIYAPDSKEDLRIHLVQEGRVITKSLTTTGETVGLEILEVEEVFGLEAMVGSYTTLARCAEYTRTLSWDIATLDQLQRAKPELAIALAQAAILHNIYFQRRIEELASMQTQERLATFLIEKARKVAGSVGEDGGITISPLTHETLSHFVGTSREIVTYYMNIFRRAGYLSFDRKSIRVFNTIGFAEWVRANSEEFETGFREGED